MDGDLRRPPARGINKSSGDWDNWLPAVSVEVSFGNWTTEFGYEVPPGGVKSWSMGISDYH